MEIMNSGQIKDFYYIESEIGEGLNSVARGVNLSTGVEVAIKIINLKEFCEDDMNYLYNEVQILSDLNHPNIVKLVEVFEDKESFYMVMELMKGGDLAETIGDSEFLAEDKAAKILRPIVDAIDYCHSNGIVHRDLKPENLLKESSKTDSLLKVSDFGMATAISSFDDVMTTICGSKDYIAPEILCEESYGYQVDCWSFGVILFYVLSGDTPFFKGTDEEKFSAIKACDWDFSNAIWEDISDEAKDLISRLLIRDPSKRLTMKEIGEHPWFKMYA